MRGAWPRRRQPSTQDGTERTNTAFPPAVAVSCQPAGARSCHGDGSLTDSCAAVSLFLHLLIKTEMSGSNHCQSCGKATQALINTENCGIETAPAVWAAAAAGRFFWTYFLAVTFRCVMTSVSNESALARESCGSDVCRTCCKCSVAAEPTQICSGPLRAAFDKGTDVNCQTLCIACTMFFGGFLSLEWNCAFTWNVLLCLNFTFRFGHLVYIY